MARILLTGPLGHGHINPTLGAAQELLRRGHDVVYAAPAPFGEAIKGTGARFIALDSSWLRMPDQRAPQFHGRAFARASELALVETKHMVGQFDAMRLRGELDTPDVVVHDGPVAWWGRVIAHDWGVPTVENWPNLVSNRHWNMQKYIRVNPLDPVFLRFIVRLARFLRSRGIKDVGGFMQGSGASDRIVTVPRAFQPAGESFVDGYSFVGPVLTDRAYQGTWDPPTGETAGLPVLLVSLGSGYHDRPEFFRMIARSARDRQWYVVMSIGDQFDPAELGDLPTNVEIHPQVPQLAVLRHATVFASHCGMGGTVEGMAAGVPFVTFPQMAEQRANADRIVELGLGRNMGPDALDASAFWDAVEAVAHDPSVHERVNWMRHEIERAGGAAAAADVVEGVIDRLA